VTKIFQEPATSKQATPGPELLDALEKHFRDASTAGIVLHQTVANRLGLHATDHKCMAMLCEFGPLSAGKMAELTGLTTGAITGVLNRLERHGHARRVRNPEDRRNINVEAVNIAEFGRRMEDLLGSLGERMRALSSTYSVAELTMIDGFIQSAIAITGEETRRLRTKQPPSQPSSNAPGTPARRDSRRASGRA
jgi:DNA-binding MarR family transcriptional regulator